MSLRRVVMLIALGAAVASLWSAPAGAVSLVVSPSTVPTGGTVTLSGDVLLNGKPGCGPATIILISGAFPGDDYGPGLGAVYIPVDATGHFRGTAVVRPSQGPGTYDIGARCEGGTVGTLGRVTVTGLPPTGAALGPFALVQAVALGVCLVLAGGVALAVGRRSRSQRPS